jgi:hypothetical protein
MDDINVATMVDHISCLTDVIRRTRRIDNVRQDKYDIPLLPHFYQPSFLLPLLQTMNNNVNHTQSRLA